MFGICGGGGYSLAAAKTDKRFKSIATLSMFNSGRVRHNGFADSPVGTIQQRLRQASDARAQEMAGGTILYAGDADMTDAPIAARPVEMYRQGYEYYWRTHAHPGSTFKYSRQFIACCTTRSAWVMSTGRATDTKVYTNR